MRMSFGHGYWRWYDFIIFGLAAVIVYLDKVLDWISDRTGRMSGRWHIVHLEAVGIACMLGAMALLMPAYPRLQWWDPLPSVWILGFVRGILWFVARFFGFDDS
jgi:hypothetical protein